MMVEEALCAPFGEACGTFDALNTEDCPMDDEMISVGDPIPRLLRVRAGPRRNVTIDWEDGRTSTIDLTPHLNHRAFAPLADDAVFHAVEADPLGWDIRWPSTKSAAIPTTVLEALENGTYAVLRTIE